MILSFESPTFSFIQTNFLLLGKGIASIFSMQKNDGRTSVNNLVIKKFVMLVQVGLKLVGT